MRQIYVSIVLLVILLVPGAASAGDPDAIEKAGLITKLRLLARERLDEIDAHPGIHALRSLGRLRDELDRRRDRALVAIFHPVDPAEVPQGSTTARTLQRIVDRRVAAVREIWDDPRVATLEPQSGIGETLRSLQRLIDDLERLGESAGDLRAHAGILPLYWYVREVGIRDYFRSEEESRKQQYDLWVADFYNEENRGDWAPEAREMARVTNDYRRMLGFTVRVRPAALLRADMEEADIVRALDAAVVEKRTPIRALRVESRLGRAARAHARSMTEGGFFSHVVPAEVAVDTGRTPAQRMAAVGYQATGLAENLARAGSNPGAVLGLWQRARSKHQSLLGVWSDIGVAHVDGRWVHLLAIGDGGPLEVTQDAKPRRGNP